MGVACFAACFFFALMGVSLMDTALLALADMIFLPGVVLVLGAPRTLQIIVARWYAAALFGASVIIVLMGWTVVGLLLQTFAVVSLFGNFLPIILLFFKGGLSSFKIILRQVAGS